MLDRRVMVRFVILCLGRSGSSHLQSMLDSHHSIRCFGEIFSDRAPASGPGFINSSCRDPSAYLENLFLDSGFPVVGFKLPMNSIKALPASAELVAADQEMRVIRLSRANLVAQLVSRTLQRSTQVSHSLQGGYDGATVRIDPDRALRALERMEDNERDLDALAEGHLLHRILYEELSDPSRLEDVQRFLGVPPAPLRSWFEKLRKRPLAETVENWDELVGRLRETRFADLAVEAP
jgi:hypothetical protein